MDKKQTPVLFEGERFSISKLTNVIRYSQDKNYRTAYPPVLPTHELMYYDSGETEIRFGNRTINMQKGSVLYLPKGVDNPEYSIYAKEAFNIYNIYFDTSCPTPAMPVVFNPDCDELSRLFRRVFNTWINRQPGYYYKSMNFTYEILELLHRSQTIHTAPGKLRFLDEAEYYMAEHYCDMNFDYEKLRKISGLSYSYFKKLFIEKHGAPPVKYVTRLKINRACELLKTQKFKVSEVAEMCGFENVYYFSNVFKKHTGVSPKNYLTE